MKSLQQTSECARATRLLGRDGHGLASQRHSALPSSGARPHKHSHAPVYHNYGTTRASGPRSKLEVCPKAEPTKHPLVKLN